MKKKSNKKAMFRFGKKFRNIDSESYSGREKSIISGEINKLEIEKNELVRIKNNIEDFKSKKKIEKEIYKIEAQISDLKKKLNNFK